MPRLFVSNFEFEHRLAYGPGGTLPQSLVRLGAALCPIWVAAADQGDAVWTPAEIDEEIFERLAALGLPRLRPVADPAVLPAWFEAVFWGEDAWAAATARRWCLRHDGCDPFVVRRVNSRRFLYELERRFGVSLPGAALVETPAAFVEAVTRLGETPAWVAKGEFGGAGREVRFGYGPPSATDLAWVTNRFRRGLAVTLEPRLERVDEAGLHFSIGRGGEVSFEGVTPLSARPDAGTDASLFQDGEELPRVWREAIDIGFQAAEAVAAEGYFGPVGIDAMRYYDTAGEVRVRPLQDLNARHTLGRLALGLRRFPNFAETCKGVFRPLDFRADRAGGLVSPAPTANPVLAAR